MLCTYEIKPGSFSRGVSALIEANCGATAAVVKP
jgi:hypothetical protein